MLKLNKLTFSFPSPSPFPHFPPFLSSPCSNFLDISLTTATPLELNFLNNRYKLGPQHLILLLLLIFFHRIIIIRVIQTSR